MKIFGRDFEWDTRAGFAASNQVLLLGALIGLFTCKIPADNRDLIVSIVSVGIVASYKDTFNYYFGSTKDAGLKNDTIATMASTAQETAVGNNASTTNGPQTT